MIIKKFRVKNYKSIIDSGDCYLEDSLTIFAGKNESGKTSLLEALQDFNTDVVLSDKIRPKSNDLLIPEICISFIIYSEELKSYFENNEMKFKSEKDEEITIIKTFPNQYSVDEYTKNLLGLDEQVYSNKEEQLRIKLKQEYSKIQATYIRYIKPHGWPFFNLELGNIIGTKNKLKEYFTNYTSSYINNIPDVVSRNAHTKSLNEMDKDLNEYEDVLNHQSDKWDYLLTFIPNFILFRSFEDNIPSSVPFDELDSNEFIQDLELISDFDSSIISGMDITKKLKHKELINVTFNKEYAQFWSQDETTLKFEWDSTTLYIYVVEEGEFFEPSQRSKGKQWHISFYTRVSARAQEDSVNILLIDEPGLFLHATAQKDIYQRLLSSSVNSQIMFTTHSPYLINPKELHRIRLVFKHEKDKGTEVVNKIHARADKETLTPILTAIGLELNEGVSNFKFQNNIIVEGPSDVFYLNAIMKILNIENINIVFGGGAGNMGNIGTILHGWGCRVLYLYDNDQGKKDGQKKLIKTWLIKKDFITSVLDISGSIEDLFTNEDFKKFVLNDKFINYVESNSEYLKINKIDKVLISKQFVNQVENNNIEMSEQTLLNFKVLVEKFASMFENYDEIIRE